jgi:hypothetical protein
MPRKVNAAEKSSSSLSSGCLVSLEFAGIVKDS